MFNEVECKLDARSVAQLRRVRGHLLKDPHYVSGVEGKFSSPAFQGRETLGRPEELSGFRVRTYYDDAHLTGYRQGVEIRIEPKGDLYKMTVKIGANRPDGGLFRRKEYAVQLKNPVPNFSTLDPKARRYLQEIYGVKNINRLKLRPMIEITSQRWRYEYHPGGDPKTLIEYAHDVAQGRTFTGFTWPLFQAELEIKSGNAAALEMEKKRLLRIFDFFREANVSKPSPGFEDLIMVLDRKQMQKFVREKLKAGQFKVFKKIP